MKKIYLFIFFTLIFSANFLSKEIHASQDLYEVQVELWGTDSNSIKEGMVLAMKELMIKMSGTSEINNYQEIKKVLENPKMYINEYRLSSKDEKIIGIFSFSGELIRNLFSNNNLPLWIGIKPKVLLFLPCKFQVNLVIDDEISLEKGDKLCKTAHQELLSKAELRNIVFIEPTLDFIDLKYLNLYQPKSIYDFLDKMAIRYGLRTWAICYILDEFGVLMEKSNCFSPVVSKENVSAYEVVELLADEISKEFQLNIDPNLRNKVKLLVYGIEEYPNLILLEDVLKSNALIISYKLKSIEGSVLNYELDVKGNISDIRRLMDTNPLLIIFSPSYKGVELKYLFNGKG